MVGTTIPVVRQSNALRGFLNYPLDLRVYSEGLRDRFWTLSAQEAAQKTKLNSVVMPLFLF